MRARLCFSLLALGSVISAAACSDDNPGTGGAGGTPSSSTSSSTATETPATTTSTASSPTSTSGSETTSSSGSTGSANGGAGGAPVTGATTTSTDASTAVSSSASGSSADGPMVDEVTVNGADATVSGLPWFKQSVVADIDVTAHVVPQISTVDVSTLELQVGGVRIDHGTATPDGSVADVYHFKVARVNAVYLASTESENTFHVLASDEKGNPQFNDATADLGIDGVPPVLTFLLDGQYPAASKGCDANDGGIGSSLVCGHDGASFYRTGDDGATLKDQIADGGSGIDSTTPSCSIPGQASCVGTYDSGAAELSFTANPSQMTMTTDLNGLGQVGVQVSARDLVGNLGTTTSLVKVTRVAWVRNLPTFGGIKGSPLLTTPINGARQLILSGNTGNVANDTIVSLAPDGGIIGLTGKGTAGAVVNNMAFSPTTSLLYVVQEGTGKLFGYNVVAAGLTPAFTCDVGGNATFLGSPALSGGDSEFALVADSGGEKLFAIQGGPSSCTIKNVSIGQVGLVTPTTDGTSVYATYDQGIASTTFSGGTFGAAKANGLGALFPGTTLKGPVSIAGGNLFFTDSSFHVRSTTEAFANRWGTNGSMNDAILGGPAIENDEVYGVAGGGDGFLRGFAAATGKENESNNPFAPSKYPLSHPAVTAGDSPQVYLGGNKQMVALQVTGGAISTSWAFKGTSITNKGINVAFASAATEPVLGDNGLLYYGADNGDVYALMTDSSGPPSASATSWPRIGFDNCNSGNSSLTNCK